MLRESYKLFANFLGVPTPHDATRGFGQVERDESGVVLPVDAAHRQRLVARAPAVQSSRSHITANHGSFLV